MHGGATAAKHRERAEHDPAALKQCLSHRCVSFLTRLRFALACAEAGIGGVYRGSVPA